MAIYDHDETAVGELDKRWIPVLNGDIYCSPSCGGKCRKSAYDEAVRTSKEMAIILGEGWKPHVYENLNWYWKVEKGNLELFLRDGVYTATIQFDLDQSYQFMASNTDPRKAVQEARSQLKEVIKKMERQYISSALDPISLPMNERN